MKIENCIHTANGEQIKDSGAREQRREMILRLHRAGNKTIEEIARLTFSGKFPSNDLPDIDPEYGNITANGRARKVWQNWLRVCAEIIDQAEDIESDEPTGDNPTDDFKIKQND